MLRRFVLTMFFLVLLLAGVLVSLVPLLLLRTKLEAPVFAMAVCLWLALALLILLPAANMLLRRIWFFRGQGEPVSLDQLRQRLLTVNAMDCPVTALARRKKIIFTWRYRELRWCELFSQLGKNRLDELHCRFDADLRTVYLCDRVRAADFLICPDRVKIGRRRIPLPLLRARMKQLAAIEQYAALAEYDYAFQAREIKSPVLGTILASGWHVRYTLF
ncbi:hypothetical protein [Desulfobulbus elongatus]|uniref:hypothetical protein n=1 Tax=Desulfobulbus elongatus TaxID=53332 RepID=UPI001B808C46|nr:hypothetical protein [Desulfobulbus elongatus]